MTSREIAFVADMLVRNCREQVEVGFSEYWVRVTPNTAEEGLIKAFSKTELRKKVIWYLEGLVFN
jgi:hypothetical protein